MFKLIEAKKSPRNMTDAEIIGLSKVMDMGGCKSEATRRMVSALLRDYVELRKCKRVNVYFEGAQVNEKLVERCNVLTNERDAAAEMISVMKTRCDEMKKRFNPMHTYGSIEIAEAFDYIANGKKE